MPDGKLGASSTVTIKGDGVYTVSASFLDQGGWTPLGNGAEKLLLVVDNGANGQGTVMDGKYLGISDVRVNGTSIGVGNAAYGPTGYEGYASDFHVFSSSDGYAILFDRWMIENTSGLPWGHTTWDGKDGTISAINPDDLKAVNNLEVDFFVTGEQGKLPEEPVLSYDYTWYPNNAIVTVEGDTVTVDYETQHASPGNLTILSECVQWFDELEDITAEFMENPQSDLAFGQTISKTDLGEGRLPVHLQLRHRLPAHRGQRHLPGPLQPQQCDLGGLPRRPGRDGGGAGGDACRVIPLTLTGAP